MDSNLMPFIESMTKLRPGWNGLLELFLDWKQEGEKATSDSRKLTPKNKKTPSELEDALYKGLYLSTVKFFVLCVEVFFNGFSF